MSCIHMICKNTNYCIFKKALRYQDDGRKYCYNLEEIKEKLQQWCLGHSSRENI